MLAVNGCSTTPAQVAPTLNIDATVEAKVQLAIRSQPTATLYPTYTPVPTPTNVPIPPTHTPLPTNTVSPTFTPLPTYTPIPRPTATPVPPPLTLLSMRCYEGGYGYMYVEGRVRNNSGKALKNVTALVEWYTSDGTFVTTHEALIDYNPILPGQTSPFKTQGKGSLKMSNCSLVFKELLGGTIRFEDAT